MPRPEFEPNRSSHEGKPTSPGDQIADMVTSRRVARGAVEARVAQIIHQERVNPLGAVDWEERIDKQPYMGD